MVAVPADTALIAPLDEFTVAIPVLLLVHAPPESPLELNVVDPLSHIACVPLKLPALGSAVTVASLVSETLAQPPLPETVYVITDVPADTPVTTPVDELIVATPVLALVHAPPLTLEPKVVVVLSHKVVVPLNVPALGDAVTVTVSASLSSLHPVLPFVTV